MLSLAPGNFITGFDIIQRMSKKLLVIKLGGAVVTYKDSPIPKARIYNIKRLVSELKLVYQKYRVVLVHGAGSFAHQMVKKSGIDKGMKTQQQKKAFSQTIESVLKLNSLIMKQLIKAKLPVITFPVHAFVTQSAGQLHQMDLKEISSSLENNQIPVLFGDMVLDDRWGCSVLSGDRIVTYIASKLEAEKVIFLTDVDGIYDKDPKKNSDARLIPEVNNKNFEAVLKGLSPTGRDDVTGEMAGKIKQIKNNLKNIQTFIINGFKQQALNQAAYLNRVGTRLLLH